jgi:hypothetical protein
LIVLVLSQNRCSMDQKEKDQTEAKTRGDRTVDGGKSAI